MQNIRDFIDQGWRLPTKEQMLSLFWGEAMDFGGHQRVVALPTETAFREFFDCFILKEGEQIWTATKDEDDDKFAWLLDIPKGKLFSGFTSERRNFRLARDASNERNDTARHSLATQGNERFRLSCCRSFVTDMASNLDWSRAAFADTDWPTCVEITHYIHPMLMPNQGIEF